MHHHNHCCRVPSSYCFPKPRKKPNRILDTTKVEIHTDEFVGESCFDRGPCCEPVPFKFEKAIKSFIIHATTECYEPGIFYTLFINHPLPDGIFADPTFVKVSKCGVFKDAVILEYTKSVFSMCEFDGHPKVGMLHLPDHFHKRCEDDEEKHECHGRREEETRLIPVELDRLGNTAFGDQFVKGIGPHPKQPLVLYSTNRGTLTLCRPNCNRYEY